MRYYVYRGTELAVTFQYGCRPIYHGALGEQVKALLAAPDASLVTAGFRFVADDEPCSMPLGTTARPQSGELPTETGALSWRPAAR